MSGNELETDLTWILNEKVKGIATQNIPFCLIRPDSLSQGLPKERREQTLVLMGQVGGRCFHLLSLCVVGVAIMIILIFQMRKVRLRECISYLLLHD